MHHITAGKTATAVAVRVRYGNSLPAGARDEAHDTRLDSVHVIMATRVLYNLTGTDACLSGT
jgi:hypothetical protein